MAISTGQINKTFVSAIDPMLDTREIYKKVTDTPNEWFLTDQLIAAGYKRPVTQYSYHNFEAETVFSSLVVAVPGSGNGTATVTFNTSAGTAGQARVDDLVLLPGSTALTAHVQSVTSTSSYDIITIKSPSGTNLTLANGNTLSIYSVAVGERSAARQNLRFGMPKRSNKIQIFSETSSITDVQAESTIEVTIPGETQDMQGYLMYDHVQKVLKLKGEIEAQKWAGEMSTTSMSDASPALTDPYTTTGGGNGPVQTTRGINKYIDAYGLAVADAASLTAYALSDFDAVADGLTAQRADNEYMICSSDKSQRAHHKMWKNLGSSGLTSVRLMLNGNDLDLTVNSVQYGKRKYYYMPTAIFDHPTLLGNSDIAKNSFFIPYDTRVKVFGGGYEPSMQVVYIKNKNRLGDEIWGESESGALAPRIPSGTIEEWVTNWVTKQGLELLGPSFYLKQKTVS